MTWEQLELFNSSDFLFNTKKYKTHAKKINFLQPITSLHYEQLEFDFTPPAKNDKQQFLKLQSQYFNGQKSKLNDMYKLCQAIALRMINKEIERHGFHLCYDDRDAKSRNAASYIIEQYLTRPDFQISEIGGYVYLRVRYELYYRTKLDDALKNVAAVDVQKFFNGRFDEIAEADSN